MRPAGTTTRLPPIPSRMTPRDGTGRCGGSVDRFRLPIAREAGPRDGELLPDSSRNMRPTPRFGPGGADRDVRALASEPPARRPLDGWRPGPRVPGGCERRPEARGQLRTGDRAGLLPSFSQREAEPSRHRQARRKSGDATRREQQHGLPKTSGLPRPRAFQDVAAGQAPAGPSRGGSLPRPGRIRREPLPSRLRWGPNPAARDFAATLGTPFLHAASPRTWRRDQGVAPCG